MYRNTLIFVFMLAACSTSSDPRCEALCVIETNGLDVCSPASADRCLELCETKVEDKTALCADCLLERASFRGSASAGAFCETNAACATAQCTLRGCLYCQDDSEAEMRCRMEVGHQVECDTEFRPVLECTTVCVE